MKKHSALMVVFVAMLGLACSGTAQATDLFWSGNGTTYGGTGTWNTTSSTNWGTSAGAPYTAQWVNGNNDTAVFGGTAGTVTLDEAITVGGLIFSTAGYTVRSNTLTFGAAGIISNSAAATIASALAGTGAITKSGAGTLTLSSTNSTYSGGTVLNAGTIGFGSNSDANLGATSGGLTFSGGQISYVDGLTLNANRTFTVNSNVSLANAITVNGVLSGNASISMTTSDGAAFNNTGNTFSGTVTTGYAMTFASLGDSSNPINIGNASSAFTWTGGAKTFALRPFTLQTTGSGQIRSSGSGALVIQQNLAITGAAGARTLELGGAYTAGANTFAGNITDYGTNKVSITKAADSSIWALSGTNTYSGATALAVGGGGTSGLIFQGMQALSPFTSLNQTAGASYGQYGYLIKILEDSATPASRSGVKLNLTTSEGTPVTDNRGSLKVFVGNNSIANGGSSSSTQTGSTIQLGDLSIAQNSYNPATAVGGLAVSGANGYKLQIGAVKITPYSTVNGSTTATLYPTTAALIVTGNVQQQAGATNANTILQMDGVNLGNSISGNILDSADGTPRALSASKTGTGTWTLSGSNSYTGGTTITTGKLLFSGANSLPASGTVAVGASGHLSLADGTARNQTVSALTLTSLGSLSFDWTGDSTGDQLTSTADITPTAGSRFYVNLNRSGTPGGSVTLLTGGAGSTLNSSTFYLANATDYTATLTPAATTVSVGSFTSQTPLTRFYWQGNKLAAGAVAGVDNAWALSDSTKGNWSSTTTNYTATALTPGATADVIFSKDQAGKTQQSTVLGADVTVNSVTIDDGTAVTIAGANGAVLTLMGTSGTAGTVASPGSAISVTANAANPTISSRVNIGADQTWHVASGKTLTVSGIVGGDYSLTKASGGTLTLSALPEYTGATTISAGALALGGGNTAGGPILSSSTLTMNQGATLKFEPSASAQQSTGGYTFSGPINLSGIAGTSTLTFFRNDTKFNLCGTLTGAAGVAQTLVISASPIGTGGDRVNVLFSGPIADGAGGTLSLNLNLRPQTAANPVFVNLSGQNTFTGSITVTTTGTVAGNSYLTIGGESCNVGGGSARNIAIMGSGYLGGGNYSGTISLGTNSVLDYLSSANQTLGGTISGTGSLQMDGTGSLTLSGNNTFSGTTKVNAGTLVLATETCLSDTNVLTITGGKLQLEPGVQEVVGSLVLGAVAQTNGIYGSSTSGATYTSDTYFAGTGRLYVGVSRPPTGTVIMVQ